MTNQDNKVGYASASVTVNKVAPQFTAADLSLSEPIATEGDTITLTASSPTRTRSSSYTVTIDWGDGSTPTVLSELDGQVVASSHAGALHLLGHAPVPEQSARRADRGHLRHPRFGIGRREHHLGRHVDRREQRGARRSGSRAPAIRARRRSRSPPS